MASEGDGMIELVRFPFEGEGSVVVETESGPGVARAARGKDVPKNARVTFEAALAEVKRAASAALDQFQSLPRPPDEVEIKFGVRMDAEAGAVIAKTGVHGQFEVSVTWRRQQPEQEPSGPASSVAGQGDE